MLAHAFITFTFRWNKPGATGVLMSSMEAIRIVVPVSPTSVPGAAVPETDVLPEAPEPALPGDELPAEDFDDEHPATRTMTASTLARKARSCVRRRPDMPPGVRDLSWLLQITMLRPHN
jgi:hypothetical protein